MIEIRRGKYIGRNKSTAYKDLIWTVATASNLTADIEIQTRETFETIEQNLKELNSSKSQIISVNIYLADINDKVIMETIWKEWIGSIPNNWPQRACLGVNLEGNVLIEATVTAVRNY